MMKAVSGALFLAVFCVVLLSGCGQKGPLFLPGEAPESQTDDAFGLGAGNDADASDDGGQSSSVPDGRDANDQNTDEIRVPPANTPLPERLTSPLGTP